MERKKSVGLHMKRSLVISYQLSLYFQYHSVCCYFIIQGHWFGPGRAEVPGLQPLDSPETHVLSLWLGSLAGVAPAEADILDLNEMVRQVTGKIPIFFYSHYGCYCRKGGQGQPRDATDR